MRGGHFHKYVESLLCLFSCLTYLDRTSCARWLSSTHRMHNYVAMHPSLYKEFCEEYFVAHKTHLPPPAIVHDLTSATVLSWRFTDSLQRGL